MARIAGVLVGCGWGGLAEAVGLLTALAAAPVVGVGPEDPPMFIGPSEHPASSDATKPESINVSSA